MGVEENKKTVQLIEDAYNRNDLDSLEQYYAPDFDNSQNRPPGLPGGIETAKMVHQMSMQAFPDRKTEIIDIIGEGNKVAAFYRITGTNKGGVPWIGAPANNNKIDFNWMQMFEFDDDGKVKKHIGVNDIYALAVQTGAINPPQMG